MTREGGGGHGGGQLDLKSADAEPPVSLGGEPPATLRFIAAAGDVTPSCSSRCCCFCSCPPPPSPRPLNIDGGPQCLSEGPSRLINDVDALHFPAVTMKYLCHSCCLPAIQTESAYLICFLIDYANVLLRRRACVGSFFPTYDAAPGAD